LKKQRSFLFTYFTFHARSWGTTAAQGCFRVSARTGCHESMLRVHGGDGGEERGAPCDANTHTLCLSSTLASPAVVFCDSVDVVQRKGCEPSRGVRSVVRSSCSSNQRHHLYCFPPSHADATTRVSLTSSPSRSHYTTGIKSV
jgi:hypothetical protein